MHVTTYLPVQIRRVFVFILLVSSFHFLLIVSARQLFPFNTNTNTHTNTRHTNARHVSRASASASTSASTSASVTASASATVPKENQNQGQGQDGGGDLIGLHIVRNALAGGLAGGATNLILYPIDTIKTMRQTDPKSIQNFVSVWAQLEKIGFSKLYAGFLPAVLGAIPSSSIYFGSYETAKHYLKHKFANSTVVSRQAIHTMSAASGNIMSSIVFVPKEAIKQQLQALKTGMIELPGGSTPQALANLGTLDICRSLYSKKGIKGFYPSYRATLMRNIPSAVIRFTMYEELKLMVDSLVTAKYASLGYLVAGTLSSITSSAFTTPFDVVKTRIATGVLPAGSPVLASIVSISRAEGLGGLYAGFQARLLWSGLFGGIGFSCFEAFKQVLANQELAANKPNKGYNNGSNGRIGYNKDIRVFKDIRAYGKKR